MIRTTSPAVPPRPAVIAVSQMRTAAGRSAAIPIPTRRVIRYTGCRRQKTRIDSPDWSEKGNFRGALAGSLLIASACDRAFGGARDLAGVFRECSESVA